MYVLVAYDVATSSQDGERRLRRVAKICGDYGQRVQNSVFECRVDPAQWVFFRKKLLDAFSSEHDSLRFYFLGNDWDRRVEHHGAKPGWRHENPMIL